MTKHGDIDVSVVIGFKDWGLERLELSVNSLHAAFGDLNGEIIISDFGSTDWEPIQKLAERSGARYHRSPDAEGWSRSRSINAGYAVARGRVLVATDADMLFSPTSMQRIVERIDSDPNLSVVLQCRDLPEGYSHSNPKVLEQDWETLELVSQIRPRWGMGGMFAATHKRVMDVGGYDNRMHTYGGEDLDFAQRIRRSGSGLLWIEDPEVRMYHIWHPPTIGTVGATKAGTEAINYNRSILKNDQSWKRNLGASEWRISGSSPACSIILIPGDDQSQLAEAVYALTEQLDVVLDIQILGSRSFLASDTQELLDCSVHEVLFIEKASAIESMREALNSATSPFVTCIDANTLLDKNAIAEICAQFAGSAAAVLGKIVPLDETQVPIVIPSEPYGSGMRLLSNSLVMVRTEMARLLAGDVSSKADWNIALAESVAKSNGRIVSSEKLLGIQLGPIGAGKQGMLGKKLGMLAFLQPRVELSAQEHAVVQKFIADLWPSESYTKGFLLSAASDDVSNLVVDELPAGATWSLIVNELHEVQEFVAFLPKLSRMQLDEYKKAGLEVKHLNSGGKQSKYLLESLASREPSDHALRHILSLDVENRLDTVTAVIFASDDKMKFEHLDLVMADGDIFRDVNVDGKRIQFLARHCVGAEARAAASKWMIEFGQGMSAGFVVPAKPDVLLTLNICGEN